MRTWGCAQKVRLSADTAKTGVLCSEKGKKSMENNDSLGPVSQGNPWVIDTENVVLGLFKQRLYLHYP